MTKRVRCAACRSHSYDVMSWQPFGPGGVRTLTAPGSHYRGFPVLRLCASCQARMERGERFNFRFKDEWYQCDAAHDSVRQLGEQP